MPTLIDNPTTIQAAGTKPKIILEYVGRVNSGTEPVSIAHMKSTAGWREPGQRPEFIEYTLVLRGEMKVTTEDGAETTVRAGQALIAEPGEWVRYSSPGPEGAQYVAVCLPAFSLDTVNRDAERPHASRVLIHRISC